MGVVRQAQLPRGLLHERALPLYGRTASRLWEEVRAAGVRAGDKLPSERVLAVRYQVSRVTLRAALGELQRRRLVSSSAARGWFVTEHAEATAPPPDAHVEGLADQAASRGLSTLTRVLDARVRPCTATEAGVLRTVVGADLYELRRLRSVDGLVVVLEHNRVPLELCPGLPATDFAHASLYATLRAAVPPQVPRMADYAVEARHPSAEEGRLLEVDGPVPVLVARQLSYNQDGRPLELTVATYRGDRYQFRARITNRG